MVGSTNQVSHVSKLRSLTEDLPWLVMLGPPTHHHLQMKNMEEHGRTYRSYDGSFGIAYFLHFLHLRNIVSLNNGIPGSNREDGY